MVSEFHKGEGQNRTTRDRSIGKKMVLSPKSRDHECETVDLIISGGTIVTVNENMDVIEDGAVSIKNGNILDVGDKAGIEERFHAAETIDAGGAVVMPGLINAHTHIPMVALRGYADDLPLEQWLKDEIWPAEAEAVTAENVYNTSKLAIAEMIRSGTTTFSDMYFFEDQIARASKEAGIRAVVGQGLLEAKTPDSAKKEQALRRAEDLILAYKDDPLITPAVAPHSTYTCSREYLKQCLALSQKYKTLLHIHLAESVEEVAITENNFGMRPVDYLDSIGGLGERTICAHCLQVNEAEIGLLKEKNAGVVFTIQSEMKLADGISRFPSMCKAGLKVGMGTDGPASNNDLNMFGEINTAALVMKVVSMDPTVADARTMVMLATMGGASVLGMEDQIGSIETGKRADIIIIGLERPHLVPMYEPHSHLAYVVDGADVDTVVIGGNIVMRDGKLLTVNEKEAMERVRRISEGLKKRRHINAGK